MGAGWSLCLDQIPWIDQKLNKMIFPSPPKIKWPKDDRFKFFQHQNVAILQYPQKRLPSAKTIIYSHGNGGDLFLVKEHLIHLSKLLDINVISYDYPNYGSTPGYPTEESCTQALATVIEYAHDQDIFDLYLLGYSLGTGVTVNYALKSNWRNPIILVAPFKSIPRVVYDRAWVDALICKYKFQSWKKVETLRCAIKIIHGHDDDIIPISHSKDLYSQIPVPNRKFKPTWIKQGDHHNLFFLIEYKIWKEVLEHQF